MKRIDLERKLRRNKKVDASQLVELLRLWEKLGDKGMVTGPGYNLSPPFTRKASQKTDRRREKKVVGKYRRR